MTTDNTLRSELAQVEEEMLAMSRMGEVEIVTLIA